MAIKNLFRIRLKLYPNETRNVTLNTQTEKRTCNKIWQIYYKHHNISVMSCCFLGAVLMSVRVRPLKYLLGWLIAGSRGGVTRARIIETLRENPQNANQLATTLEMDYRTIRHHLKILEKNRITTSTGDGYGKTYFLSVDLEENYSLFEEILNKLWKKQKRENKK